MYSGGCFGELLHERGEMKAQTKYDESGQKGRERRELVCGLCKFAFCVSSDNFLISLRFSVHSKCVFYWLTTLTVNLMSAWTPFFFTRFVSPMISIEWAYMGRLCEKHVVKRYFWLHYNRRPCTSMKFKEFRHAGRIKPVIWSTFASRFSSHMIVPFANFHFSEHLTAGKMQITKKYSFGTIWLFLSVLIAVLSNLEISLDCIWTKILTLSWSKSSLSCFLVMLIISNIQTVVPLAKSMHQVSL